MKSQSNVLQDRIWIRYVEDNYCTFRLRDNFKELQRNGLDEQVESYYEYDEVELKILDRENIEQYINANFNELFQLGLELEAKEKTENGRQIKLNELIVEGKIIEENEMLKRENEMLKADNQKLKQDMLIALGSSTDLFELLISQGVI